MNSVLSVILILFNGPCYVLAQIPYPERLPKRIICVDGAACHTGLAPMRCPMKIGAIPLTIVTFYTLVAFQLDGLAVDRKEAAFDGRSMPVDSLVQAATKQFDAGDAQEATRVFQEVVRIDPGNAKAHLMLGAIWLGQRRFEEAEEAFNQACHTDDSADSWYGLGMVAAGGDQSRKKEALKRFREALRRDPHLFDARYQLALTLRGLGEGNAEAEMEQLARLDPHYGLAYLQLSRWAEQKPHGSEVAMEWCQRGLKVLPEDRGPHARVAGVQAPSTPGHNTHPL